MRLVNPAVNPSCKLKPKIHHSTTSATCFDGIHNQSKQTTIEAITNPYKSLKLARLRQQNLQFSTIASKLLKIHIGALFMKNEKKMQKLHKQLQKPAIQTQKCTKAKTGLCTKQTLKTKIHFQNPKNPNREENA